MARQGLRPHSTSTIRTSTSARYAAPECCGGNIDPARRCTLSGPRSGTGSTSLAISISPETGRRYSGIGRPTSFRSRGPTGSAGSRDYSLLVPEFLAGLTFAEVLRVLLTRRDRPL